MMLRAFSSVHHRAFSIGRQRLQLPRRSDVRRGAEGSTRHKDIPKQLERINLRPIIPRSRAVLLRSLGTDADRPQDPQAFADFVAGLSPPRRKFLDAINAYKREHFSNQTPARFFKQIVAAADANGDGVVTVDELRALLRNIGAEDAMTEEETLAMVEEVGVDRGGERVITVEGIEARWTPYLSAMWRSPVAVDEKLGQS